MSQVILGAVINLALLGLFVLHFYRNGFKRRKWIAMSSLRHLDPARHLSVLSFTLIWSLVFM